MQEILSPVPCLLMELPDPVPLFLVVPRAIPHPRELPLLLCYPLLEIGYQWISSAVMSFSPEADTMRFGIE